MSEREYPLEGPEEPETPPAEDSAVLGAPDDEVTEDQDGTPKENPSG
jgi:hypothetical protein